MSIVVTVDFLLKDQEGAAAMTATMKERLPFTRSYDGCEELYLYVDEDDPNHLVLIEQWESRGHYDRYREWAMAQPGTDKLLTLLAREMTSVYLNKADV